MSKQKPPKQMIVGWGIIRNILLKVGTSDTRMKALSAIWIDIYKNDPNFQPAVIARRMMEGMKDSLLSEDKLRKKLEEAKRSYAHLLTDFDDLKVVLDPQSVILNSLLHNIVLHLKEKVDVSDLNDDLMEGQLMKMDLSGNAVIEVARWSDGLVSAVPEESSINMSMEDSKIIVHYLYIWTCEEIGPTQADQLFSDAIRISEMLPESGQCSPKSFL